MCKPLLNKNLLNFPSAPFTFGLGAMAKRKVRETEMAVNIEMSTPRPSVKAKPFTAEVPSQKSTIAVMIEEMFESRIESQARWKPSCKAS